MAKSIIFLTNLDTWYGMVWFSQYFRVERLNFCQQDKQKKKIKHIFWKNNVILISMFFNKTGQGFIINISRGLVKVSRINNAFIHLLLK